MENNKMTKQQQIEQLQAQLKAAKEALAQAKALAKPVRHALSTNPAKYAHLFKIGYRPHDFASQDVFALRVIALHAVNGLEVKGTISTSGIRTTSPGALAVADLLPPCEAVDQAAIDTIEGAVQKLYTSPQYSAKGESIWAAEDIVALFPEYYNSANNETETETEAAE